MKFILNYSETIIHDCFFSDQDEKTSERSIATAEWVAAIKEEADKFVIIADIPGVKPEDIEVSMEAGVLTVIGKKRIRSQSVLMCRRKNNYRISLLPFRRILCAGNLGICRGELISTYTLVIGLKQQHAI